MNPASTIARIAPQSFVLVVGGGSAGVAAALAVARRNTPVVLVEPAAIGGNSTAGGVNTWEPGINGPGLAWEFYQKLSQYPRAVALSRTSKDWTSAEPWSRSSIFTDPQENAAGYFRSLRRAGLKPEEMVRVTFEPDILSRVMEDALLETGRVQLLTGWRFLECSIAHRRIKQAHVGEGRQTLELLPAVVIDATAQIHVARSAGCKASLGAESRDQYGEPSAPEMPINQINGVTLCFRVRKKDHPGVDPFPEGITGMPYPGNYSITEYPNGDLNINTLPLMEGMEFMRMEPGAARKELVSRVHRTWLWLQKEKGFDGYEMATIFPLVGVREGPRLVGRHVLTENEVRAGCSAQANAETWVALADHALDVHGAGHMNRELEQPYGIPYDCLLPREIDNLAVACRGASFTHIAGSSCRLSRTMIDLGHAAGIAAVLAMNGGTPLANVQTSDIQRELAHDNVSLAPKDSRFARKGSG